MLLSGYRNPPFKPPARNSTSTRQTPPLGSQSPKRKHSDDVPDSTASVASLRIETTLHDGAESGADSPRTKVAEKLQDLKVSSGESPKKKLKLERSVDAVTPDGRKLEISDSMDVVRGMEGAVVYENDSEDDGERVGFSSPTPDQRSAMAFGNPASPEVVIRRAKPKSKMKEGSSIPDSQSMQEMPRRPSSPPLLSASTSSLTWQQEEITGHDIDLTAPDDDGEGINGIGFRPTPAMAYARSQKRRQQVSDWKAREAREARQRRIEKRRGAAGSRRNSGEGLGMRRVVRFAEIRGESPSGTFK